MLIYKPYGPSLLSNLYLIAFLAESAGVLVGIHRTFPRSWVTELFKMKGGL